MYNLMNFAILQAGPAGRNSLVTIASSVIALGVFMIWFDHIKSKKKNIEIGFNKGTGLLLIFFSLALMVVSSWI